MRVSENGRSVTATARRAQIVGATIETIGELGYAQATFARIAERAGLSSTRLISYHFAGKDELIQAVVGEVYAAIEGHMRERMAGVAGAREALRAYIRGVVGFIASHRVQMQALMSVFLERGSEVYDTEDERRAVGPLQGILDAGQRSGEFRAFDSFVMATAIQRSLDGLPFLLRGAPDLDLAAYAEELATLFDLATRSRP